MQPGQRMDLPRSQQSMLDAEVGDGENLIWSGQPNPARFAKQYLPHAIFGLVFGAAAACLYFSRSPVQVERDPGGGLIYMLFVVIGMSMLMSPLSYYNRAKKTIYAVTNKRAIIIPGVVWPVIQSFFPADIGQVSRIDKADGSGDVIFARGPSGGIGPGSRPKSPGLPIGFVGVADARGAEKLIRTLKYGEQQAPRPKRSSR